MNSVDDFEDRLAGVLLGTAVGDALGLPCEGMSARAIARRFGVVDRFRLLGRTGFVSDDTEQSALLAQSLAKHPDDVGACVRAFRRSMLGWFCRLPWGVGWGTLRSCIRIGLGIHPSGVMSAGNGAAMRASVVGGFFRNQSEERRALGKALAEVTHRDPRAVEGALFTAEVAAACSNNEPGGDLAELLHEARAVVSSNQQLGEAIDHALVMADEKVGILEAARVCGTSGFVVHTLAFASFCLARTADDPSRTLVGCISAGGDTDTIAAILGAWLGALHGESGLPLKLVSQIHDGPFGPTHLRALAACLSVRRSGADAPIPGYSATAALARNLALYPVILGHGLRRLAPF